MFSFFLFLLCSFCQNENKFLSPADGTVLYVSSKNGVYNNKSLDMLFSGEVKASYIESKLFADKAEYSNSKSFLVISELK